jgi:hypothetical protein
MKRKINAIQDIRSMGQISFFTSVVLVSKFCNTFILEGIPQHGLSLVEEEAQSTIIIIIIIILSASNLSNVLQHGNFITSWGSEITSDGQYLYLRDVAAVDSSDKVYI